MAPKRKINNKMKVSSGVAFSCLQGYVADWGRRTCKDKPHCWVQGFRELWIKRVQVSQYIFRDAEEWQCTGRPVHVHCNSSYAKHWCFDLRPPLVMPGYIPVLITSQTPRPAVVANVGAVSSSDFVWCSNDSPIPTIPLNLPIGADQLRLTAQHLPGVKSLRVVGVILLTIGTGHAPVVLGELQLPAGCVWVKGQLACICGRGDGQCAFRNQTRNLGSKLNHKTSQFVVI